MRSLPSCILYSTDDGLAGRLIRMASSVAALHPVTTRIELEQWVSQFGDTVLLADLRSPHCLDAIASLRKTNPATIVIALGSERSDPMLAVELLEPFSMISLDPERKALQSLLKQAIECLSLRQKTKVLEEELATLRAQKREPRAEPRTLFSAPLQNFSKAQQNFDNVEILFESVVEGLVATARVSRAGIFIKAEGQETYRFQSGTRCLKTTENLEIRLDNPFIRWLEMNTHLISRQTLDTISSPEERAMLKQMLDSLGAEIIIPLYATGGIKGWIFVGQRSSGIPFDLTDMDDLSGLADHISTTLEKAFQYEKTVLQKALAETVLHSIPLGIIACDENAIIRWFNSTAREILKPDLEEIIGKPVKELGSRVADMLRRSIRNQENSLSQEWTENRTNITLSAETRTLLDKGHCVGAMMILRDMTGVRLLKEREEQLERAAFWNELASSMSHEIRNPLVAIKTFAQLLPQRYEDPDFRAEFSTQVMNEVEQLNHIIEKINEFANPPRPIFKPIDIRKPIEQAVTRLHKKYNHENLKIHLSADDSDLKIKGDLVSIEEGIYHLLKNATENLDNKPGSRINVIVKGKSSDKQIGTIFIMITDNGTGIDEALRDKIFSPFSTIKARGLGLGLPIVKRAIIDHNGQMDLDTSDGGTTVTIELPSLGQQD